MKNREDLNKYHTNATFDVPRTRTEGELAKTAGPTVKAGFGILWKTVKTVLFVVMITGMICFISMATYILSFRDIEAPDLDVMSLRFSSHVKVCDENGNPTRDYLTLHAEENRIWVYYEDIPKHMLQAIIAIEDKRFLEHEGVDWRTTVGSAYKLLTNADDSGGGGSTLTQQLIKNITDRKEVSIMRKVTEIFKALNLEKKYTKSEILEAYLNVVDFGSGTRGVEAAAQLYFGKSISECDIAECASIAGITQYPYKYTPLNSPENNKKRQQDILWEMLDQGRITRTEYDEAMAKSENMVFIGYQYDDTEEDTETEYWNWYMETMMKEVVEDLMSQEGISEELAWDAVYNRGLTIYSAMNPEIQTGVEELFSRAENQPSDPTQLYGIYVVDYSGKTIAVVGGRGDKLGNRLFNYATDEPRQTGSSMKPIGAYAPAFELDLITYGTALKDEQIPDYYGPGRPGPNNYDHTISGTSYPDEAIRNSLNLPAAQLVNEMGAQASYDFLTQKLGVSTLVTDDIALSPLALGGLTRGISMQEMAGAYQIFGSGGVYRKPYTYLYVEDHDGFPILDNRNKEGIQAMTPENAHIMKRLLEEPVYRGTASGDLAWADLPDMFGKTGTTEYDDNVWFVGGTSFAVAAVWNGFQNNDTVYEHCSNSMWRTCMEYLYQNHYEKLSNSGYTLSENVTELYYCRSSGLIAGASCFSTSLGLYSNENMPRTCNGGSDHKYGKKSNATPEPDGSPEPTIEPDETPGGSPEPTDLPSGLVSENPDITPTPGPDVPPGPDEPTPTPAPEESPTPPPEISSESSTIDPETVGTIG